MLAQHDAAMERALANLQVVRERYNDILETWPTSGTMAPHNSDNSGSDNSGSDSEGKK